MMPQKRPSDIIHPAGPDNTWQQPQWSSEQPDSTNNCHPTNTYLTNMHTSESLTPFKAATLPINVTLAIRDAERIDEFHNAQQHQDISLRRPWPHSDTNILTMTSMTQITVSKWPVVNLRNKHLMYHNRHINRRFEPLQAHHLKSLTSGYSTLWVWWRAPECGFSNKTLTAFNKHQEADPTTKRLTTSNKNCFSNKRLTAATTTWRKKLQHCEV